MKIRKSTEPRPFIAREWLVPNTTSGRRWCKRLTDMTDIDIQQSGGYALQAPFINFDGIHELDDNQFMVVACQQAVGIVSSASDDENESYAEEYMVERVPLPEHKYEYQLIAGGRPHTKVTADELSAVFNFMLRASVPTKYLSSRRGNSELYVMAIYCYASFFVNTLFKDWNTLTADLKVFVQQYMAVIAPYRHLACQAASPNDLTQFTVKKPRRITYLKQLP